MIFLFPIDDVFLILRKTCLITFEEQTIHFKELLEFKYRHDFVRDVLFEIFLRVGAYLKNDALMNFLTHPQEGRSTLRPTYVLVYRWV